MRRTSGLSSGKLRTDDLQQMPTESATAIQFSLNRAGRTPVRQATTPTHHSQEISMQILSARHVKTEESLRLGVVSGWYSTKVSGTFVTGPHTTQEDCLSKILELNPPPAKKKF
jgi:hypothetical protein